MHILMLCNEHFPIAKGEDFSVKDGEGRVVETWRCTSVSRSALVEGKLAVHFQVDGHRDVRWD